MEEISSKNDLIKDRSVALIPGHSVTYQMTPLSLSKDFRIFFFFFLIQRVYDSLVSKSKSVGLVLVARRLFYCKEKNPRLNIKKGSLQARSRMKFLC